MARKKDDTDDDDIKLGQDIVRLRRAANMTQEDLAGKAEIDRSYLSEIESGYKNISIRTLKKIAKALGVKVSTLLREK
jgi:transcriptional regulator with XRE-family HTH domain